MPFLKKISQPASLSSYLSQIAKVLKAKEMKTKQILISFVDNY